MGCHEVVQSTTPGISLPLDKDEVMLDTIPVSELHGEQQHDVDDVMADVTIPGASIASPAKDHEHVVLPSSAIPKVIIQNEDTSITTELVGGHVVSKYTHKSTEQPDELDTLPDIPVPTPL